ncbi:hypothetical protein A9Q98_08640 [Thalassotalea sp. 42_200_T64]|nr:hypothetical protein A9Q98_08640 [Thalassotalea sp. 42_200_T64]
MNAYKHEKMFQLIKEHAIAFGDCVSVYDPVLDKVVESTDCFMEIIDIDPASNHIKAQWLAKMKLSGQVYHEELFQIGADLSPVFKEYELVHVNGSVHHIRQVNYPYFDQQDPEKTLVLITLRDCNHEYRTNPKHVTENWRKENSSQVRYLRKILALISNECQADFAMLAIPSADKQHAQSLVAIQDGEFIDDLNYALKGTPCEITVNGSICAHKNDIQNLYPEDNMLVNMQAESYIGVPFFDEEGLVSGYLVIIKKTSLQDKSYCKKLIENYQAQLNRRIQLYFADKQLAQMCQDKSGFLGFDQEQFLLGTTPSSKELASWSNISKETFNSVKEAILITDADNNIIHCNRAFTDITGYSLAEVLAKNPSVLSSGLHDAVFYQQMEKSLAETGIWEGEIINKNKSGKTYSEWLFIRVVFDENQQATHHIAVFSDISKHKEKEELLYFQANYDPLTMLPNRSLLFFTLAESLTKLEEQPGKPIVLMHIDLNGLARINENFDYNVGDALLVETARRIKRIINDDSVMVARISGDNFVVLFSCVEHTFDADNIATRLCQELAKAVLIDQKTVKITANIGIAETSNSTLNPESLYSMAEQALLNAKLEGLGQFCVFDEQLRTELKNTWQLEQELNVAIAEDQFVLHYQPQIDASSGELLGLEALVRWQHPQRGLLAPFYFISLAEKTDQIVDLGTLVLRKACRQIALWQQTLEQTFTVSVNISPRQFALESSANTMQSIIEESAIDTSGIILEITEDVLMADHSDLLTTLGALNEGGIKLSLDDFGTGFSSLSYLQQYPLSELKIDRSFVKSLGHKPESLSIVKAIISMANSLNLKVVAEGVETVEQRDILADLGCDIFQGFYYAKPLAVADLTEFIKQ